MPAQTASNEGVGYDLIREYVQSITNWYTDHFSAIAIHVHMRMHSRGQITT